MITCDITRFSEAILKGIEVWVRASYNLLKLMMKGPIWKCFPLKFCMMCI